VSSVNRSSQRPAPRAARVGGWVLASLLAICGAACSLIVESETNQCTTDTDCSRRFNNGSVCQSGICVKPGDNQNDGGGGADAGDCFQGEPKTNEDYLNQCTNADCIPFDNCTRLGLCNGGKLPPLVDPPDGGV
jgi:hypothetical protein